MFLAPFAGVYSQEDATFLISVYDKSNFSYDQQAFITENNECYFIGKSNSEDTLFVDGPFDKLKLAANGDYVHYIIKTDWEGNVLWFRHYLGKNVGGGIGIASGGINANGDFILLGQADGLVDYQPGDGVQTADIKSTQMFIATLDADGVVKDFKTTSRVALRGRVYPNKMTISADGTIYIFGSVEDGADFDFGPGVTQVSSDLGEDGEFIAAYNSNLALKWVRLWRFDNLNNLAFRANINNDLVVVGEHRRLVDVDPSADTANLGFNNFFMQNHIFIIGQNGELKNSGFFGTPFHETDIREVSVLPEGTMVYGTYNGYTDIAPLINDTINLNPISSEFSVFLDNDLKVQWFDTNNRAPQLIYNPKGDSYAAVRISKYGNIKFREREALYPTNRPFEFGPTIAHFDKDLYFQEHELFTGSSNGFDILNTVANNDFFVFAGRAYKELNFGPNAIKSHSNRSQEDPIFGLLVNTVTPAGVYKNSNKGSIKVYPNPSSKSIQVLTDLESVIKLQITDALGKVLYEKEEGNFNQSIDVSDFKEGMYFVTVETKQSKRTTKFVKQ